MSVLFKEIARWAAETFPDSTPDAKLAHLRREFRELEAAPADPEEIADCIMILVHLGEGQGFDMEAELWRKLAINRARTWGKPDAEGVVEHIRG